MGIVEEAHSVKVMGSGEKTIILGHGFGTDQSVWKHLVPYLVDEYRVVLYDNMGAGPTNPDYFDFDRYSSLEVALLTSIVSGRKCHATQKLILLAIVLMMQELKDI
ncbi:hypothetical protein RND71_032978 [Anisodus tanguticus]|uniref:AB hydrolase-1 domain-containing protein n=1 Tax=Anisodus tanguticus TaxID=243964 RepID=A0AAE1R8I3_9SOLA|nr:hypothetical protein RND71_032978 [Anisodus tanguticus]